tara:strand:- start:281 stop:562 length:282 start_codon:yes stop_codon:yes gene_type:complete
LLAVFEAASIVAVWAKMLRTKFHVIESRFLASQALTLLLAKWGIISAPLHQGWVLATVVSIVVEASGVIVATLPGCVSVVFGVFAEAVVSAVP